VNHQGRHLLVELYGCDARPLDDASLLAKLLRTAAEAAGSKVVAEVFHPFAPHGVTGVMVIEESHLSVHTWPERGYAAVDFYTCGKGDPERALQLIAAGLAAERAFVLEVTRGGDPELALQPSPRRRLPSGA
jgi:S-adenosylmethionine decarboxylase proenzyme